MATGEDFGVRNRAHLPIDIFRQNAEFEAPTRPQNRRPLRQDYAAHADALLGQLAVALGEVPRPADDGRLPIDGLKLGTLIEVSTLEPSQDSRAGPAKVPAGLAFPAQEIIVLQTRRTEARAEQALLFVPDDARTFLRGRLADYGRDPGHERRSDIERFEVVETISRAGALALFVGDLDLSNVQLGWWEIWVQGPHRAHAIAVHARTFGLDVHADRLAFPDTTVVFIHGSLGAIAEFALRVPGAIGEIRRATGSIEPFLDRSAHRTGQHEWTADLVGRVVPCPDGAPVVCILDTGVAAAHPLVRPGLQGAWAYDEAWGGNDHAARGGHGTALVGLALYGDLEPLMASTELVQLRHGVESMKFLPPPGFQATPPPSYGVVTQGAVALVETERPNVLRSFCIASSTEEFPPGRPSTWSGALDQIASGAMSGDERDEFASQAPKRLLMVATGNVTGGMRADVLRSQPLEDPAQSWNALSIGGFTTKEQAPVPPPHYSPAVGANHRSPFSRGSCALPLDLTPIKPEVLFEAGNMLAGPDGFCGWHPAVSLLAPGNDIQAEPLVPFWATSAAVGVAGNFVGQLTAALPNLWPETYRALVVDSAQWPAPIRSRLIGRGAHWKTSTSKQRQQIIREVGYGVPALDRAQHSAANDFSLIAEAEIQPFKTSADGRGAVFNEMHFYDLPWPRSGLERLENEVVTMKVTLSYFIEPNLTGRAATRPDTYRSFGLRFAFKRRNETATAFRARVNAAQHKDSESSATQEASCWLLGPKAMQAGSLHCDIWRGYAIDLAGHDAVAVFPVGGWWKSHLGQRRANDKGRYSLVISISAPGQAVDLHAEVAAKIDVKARATVEVELPRS